MGQDINISFHAENMAKIEQTEEGRWIGLRVCETTHLKHGEYKELSLGVFVEIPEGYEAHMVLRDSTVGRYGIILPHGMLVIDQHTYGNWKPIWKLPIMAMKDTTIKKNDKICRFRLVKKMDKVNIIEHDR